MWKTKKCISLLLVFCLLSALLPGMCMAAEPTYQITETELTRLEQNSVTLRQQITELETKLANSQEDCKTLRMELEASQISLNNLKTEASNLKVTSEMLKSNLEVCEKSLTKTTEYINQYEKESKAEIRKLTAERDIAIGLLIYDLFFRKK